MITMNVKKKKFEKRFGNRKIVCYVYNICETIIEGGSTTMNFYQLYDVIEIWDFRSSKTEGRLS